jgi:hypothetical protein
MAATDRERPANPGCGDASACLKLRIPVIRRDRSSHHQQACQPAEVAKIAEK